jgi:hypothetical protein
MTKEKPQAFAKGRLLAEVLLLHQHVVQVHEQPRLGEHLPEPHGESVGDLKTLHETSTAQEPRVFPQAVRVGVGEEGLGHDFWVLKLLGHSEAVVQVPLETTQHIQNCFASLGVVRDAFVRIDPIMEHLHGMEYARPVPSFPFVVHEHVDAPSGVVVPRNNHQNVAFDGADGPAARDHEGVNDALQLEDVVRHDAGPEIGALFLHAQRCDKACKFFQPDQLPRSVRLAPRRPVQGFQGLAVFLRGDVGLDDGLGEDIDEIIEPLDGVCSTPLNPLSGAGVAEIEVWVPIP